MEKRQIFEKAKAYLLQQGEGVITHEILEAQIHFSEDNKPKTMDGLYKKMLEHAKNRQQMPNVIGDINELEEHLFKFSPNDILQHYHKWEDVFNAIDRSNYSPHGSMNKNNKRSLWVQFSKSIISIAKFLSRFEKIEDFNKYIDLFLKTEDTRAALALLLGTEIHGYGFALACDFLKENVSPEYVKPDVHIKYIFTKLGISKKSSDMDWQIYRDAIAFAQEIGEKPYTVDKVFWLVGSGNFYNVQKTIRVSTKKFIESIKNGKTFIG